MSLDDKTVSFIGSGIMAEAIITGLLKKKLIRPDRLIAAHPRPERGHELVHLYGLHATLSNSEAARSADILVLCVKPQVMSDVLEEIRENVGENTLVVSIAAGISLAFLRDGLGVKYVVRAMPNTPGQIGQGMTVWTAAADVSEEGRGWAELMLGALGETLFVRDEKYLDMATALNGSGPSYVFLLMEAMIDAGVHMGFSRRDAERLVLQTMRGSVEYAAESGLHPAELRRQVTSPGGTSAAALYQLEKGSIRTVISRAIWAAYNRSVELGKGDK